MSSTTYKSIFFSQLLKDFKTAFDKHEENKTLIWPDLCGLDSDGDSKTNGEELGDKECAWRFNSDEPASVVHTGITHPGMFIVLDSK